ncbi:MAG: HD-GYP domain-containing protein [Desulfovibrio sp.]|nr:HD-GYP domain-containing protein [Desulfovibrio sp.]
MAFVHINIKDLRPGMYIVHTGESWQDKPFLYAKPGLIRSEAEVADIVKQGFLEAYYDPELSENQSPAENRSQLLTRQLSRPLPVPTILLKDELAKQEKAYEHCVEHLQRIMEDARHGQVKLSSSKPYLENIIQSIKNNVDALTSLAKIKVHDEYTYAHCVNVSIFSVAFGRYLGCQDQTLLTLGLAGLFHDIGKMRVPLGILNAPRSLSAAEFELIKKHVIYGEEMLASQVEVSADLLAGVSDHHERFNGSGYPRGKKGQAISDFGSIISVCDVYDALSSRRVYKEALPPNKALSIMYELRGEAWPPGLVEHFIKMLGIYPVGTPIALTSGFKGVVVKSNPQAPLYPTVVICRDRQGQVIAPAATIDLAKQHDFQIIKALDMNTIDFDIFALLTGDHAQTP